jgi:hypothetical protein
MKSYAPSIQNLLYNSLGAELFYDRVSQVDILVPFQVWREFQLFLGNVKI